MSEDLTIVVVPRDRFSSVGMCVESILKHTTVPFRIAVLDLGYSKKDLDQVRKLCANIPLDIESYGPMIPVLAFAKYLPKITTKYTAWVDNDTFATPQWMETILARAAKGARVIM